MKELNAKFLKFQEEKSHMEMEQIRLSKEIVEIKQEKEVLMQ